MQKKVCPFYGFLINYMRGNVLAKILAISGYKAFELGIFQKDHPSVTYIKKAIEKELMPMIDDG